MLKVLDLGFTFGMSTDNIFHSWVSDKKAEVFCPPKYYQDDILKADLICFGGGADIHPSLYNHRNVASWVAESPSNRDLWEKQAFLAAIKAKKPVLGICRGAQLVCALSGGVLIQNVENHTRGHLIETNDGRSFPMSSLHHQMMYLNEIVLPHSELIAWSQRQSKKYIHDIPNFEEPEVEPEIVLFKNTQSLAVQGHPEMMSPYSKTVKYVLELIETKLLKNGDTREAN